mgnify:FL=1|jgi:hypothetical protein
MKKLFRKIIDAIFGKRCACKTKSICDHLNLATKIEYCLDCNQVIGEK